MNTDKIIEIIELQQKQTMEHLEKITIELERTKGALMFSEKLLSQLKKLKETNSTS